MFSINHIYLIIKNKSDLIFKLTVNNKINSSNCKIYSKDVTNQKLLFFDFVYICTDNNKIMLSGDTSLYKYR